MDKLMKERIREIKSRNLYSWDILKENKINNLKITTDWKQIANRPTVNPKAEYRVL